MPWWAHIKNEPLMIFFISGFLFRARFEQGFDTKLYKSHLNASAIFHFLLIISTLSFPIIILKIMILDDRLE